MDIINFESFENMAEYQNSIKDLSVEKLQEEYDKIAKKLNLNYIYVDDGYYTTKKCNIYDQPTQVFRVYHRKRIAFVNTFLSGCFKQRGMDYALAWSYVNDKFTRSTQAPYFIEITLRGKNVPLADKLTYHGCLAYKNYLMLVYDYLDNKGYNLENAVNCALKDEIAYDKKYDRSKFYTRYYLPSSLNVIHKNILKLSVLKKTIKEKKAIEELK